MSKVASPTLITDQVFAAIREEIMNGAMPAGYRLRIRDLAAQVGTSVMPVREAIRRLEEAGLAERMPHKGAVVKGLTLEELRHVYRVRSVLETEATRLGSANVTQEGAALLENHCERMAAAVRAGDTVAALDADEAMLLTLYEFGGNPVLLELIQGLWQRCRHYKIVGARRAAEQADDTLWSFQPRLVAAARVHDVVAAVAITHESMVSAMDRIERQIAEQTRQAEPAESVGSAAPA